MGDQNFSAFDELFSELGTEFSPELREKEVASAAPPLGDVASDPSAPASPEGAASTGSSDEGYDIDSLLGELDGEGFTAASTDAPEYLDLGGSSAPQEDEMDFATFQQEKASRESEPADTSGLDALLGDYADPPVEGTPPSPAPDPAAMPSEPASAQEPEPADDEMASFLDELEDVGTISPESQPLPEDDDFLADFVDETDAPGGATPEDDDFLSELESGGVASGDDDLFSDLEGSGPPPEGEDFLADLEGLDETAPPIEEGDFLAGMEGEAAPAEGGDDLFGDFDDAFALDEATAPTPVSGDDPSAGPDFDADAGQEELDLTDEDLLRIQKRILILTPELQDGVRRAIVEATLPPASVNMLVRMLLSQRTPQEIREYLEQQTGEVIQEPIEEDFLGEDLAARPARAKGAGLENILPILRIGALLGGIFILGLLLFLLVIKPGIDAKKSYRKGLTEISRGNWQDAEKYFKKGQGLGGKDVDWYIRYGLEYRKKKEYPWAIKKFRQGLDVEPGHFRTWLLLGETYALKRDLGMAHKIFKDMQKAYPGNLRVLEKIGDIFIINGDRSRAAGDEKLAMTYYGTAERYYDDILKKEWKDLNGQFKMLRAYERMDKQKKGRRFVDIKLEHIKHISKKAVHVPIFTEVAAYYQRKKEWERSKELLKQVLGRNYRYPLANYYMGRYYQAHQDWARGRDSYKRAIDYDDSDPRFYNNLGEVYLSFSEPRQALALTAFEEAKKLDLQKERSSYFKPYVNLGFLYYEQIAVGDKADLNLLEKNYQEALNNFRLAELRLRRHVRAPADFDSTRYFYYYGWLHYRQDRVQEALELWNKVYMHNPFHPVVSFAMGNGWLHQKKHDLAIPEFEKNILYFDRIARGIPEISPANTRHKQVIEWLAYNYNNIGVAYMHKHQVTGDPRWERQALQSFYKARELGDKLSENRTTENDYFWHNINVVLKPERKLNLAIAPERLSKDRLPRFLTYPQP